MPQAVLIMEFSAAFRIQSKFVEIAQKRRAIGHCEEKNVKIVRLKNGVVKIEDFEFVEEIEKRIDLSEIWR